MHCARRKGLLAQVLGEEFCLRLSCVELLWDSNNHALHRFSKGPLALSLTRAVRGQLENHSKSLTIDGKIFSWLGI